MKTNEKYDFSKFEEYIENGYFEEDLKSLQKMHVHYLELAIKDKDNDVYSDKIAEISLAVRNLTDVLETIEANTEEPKPAKKAPKAVKRSSDANKIIISNKETGAMIDCSLWKDYDNDRFMFINTTEHIPNMPVDYAVMVLSREQVSELHEFLGDILERTGEENE
ncbi:MAG: hypothetical protein LBK94_05260 [Prevotellaceae bacterium]|jgi:hypothetical protein|nr:hypothetical protein [Prevotellaceae bacterium]